LDHSGCKKLQQKPKEAPDDEAIGLNCVRLAVTKQQHKYCGYVRWCRVLVYES